MSIGNFTKVLRCANRSSVNPVASMGYGVPVWRGNEQPLYYEKAGKPYECMRKIRIFPIIGSAWAYLPYIGKYKIENKQSSDIEKYRQYGSMVREKIGGVEIVNCYRKDGLKVLDYYADPYPSRGEFSSLKKYREKRQHLYRAGGLLVTEGEHWSILRRKIEDYLTNPQILSHYAKPLRTIASDFVELIRRSRDSKDEVEDVVALLNKWAFEAVGSVSLGTRLGCLQPNLTEDSDGMKLIYSVETQLDCMNKLEASAGNVQIWRYLPTPTWRKFVKAADVFSSIIFNYVCFATRRHEEKGTKPGERPSLLNYLTEVERADRYEQMAIVSDLIMAGVDTTSYTAAFLLYELAKNPTKQEEALKELNQFLPHKEHQPTLEEYGKLDYLKNCLKESMRLHPPTRAHVRIVKHDMEIGGYKIPAGTTVLVIVETMYKDSWMFPSPDSFEPKRWSDYFNCKKQENAVFHPFGGGNRNCIGNKLAELEILAMVSEVLRSFTMEYNYEDVGIRTKLINCPDRPIKLRFLER